MDAIIETIQQLLIDWGYPGLFISALLAGSIVPFSSELVLIALVKLGLDPMYCILSASMGNTVGGMSCYYIGYLGKTEWVEKYLKVSHEKIIKMQERLHKRGSLMAFFAFLPGIGEVIAIALGFMRSNVYLTFATMFLGKFIRYVALTYPILYAVDEFSSLFTSLFK